MPGNQRVFHFVVPGLLEAVKAFSSQLPKATFPSLEKFFSVAAKSVNADDFSHLLADLFGYPVLAGRDIPIAALAAQDQVSYQEVVEHCWIQAYPVMLKPDRDRLVLHLPASRYDAVNDSQAIKRLSTKLLDHFSSLFSKIIVTQDHGWLIKLQTIPDMRTTALMDAVGRNIDSLLPVGNDARQWHAILNEIQMLFHSLNSIDYGFNALWFQGCGQLSASASAPASDESFLIANDALSHGLAIWSGAREIAHLGDPEITNSKNMSVLAVDLKVMQAIYLRSEQDWFDAVKQIDSVLHTALQQIKSNRLSLIHIYPVQGAAYTVRKIDLFRFWQKKRSLAYWSEK